MMNLICGLYNRLLEEKNTQSYLKFIYKKLFILKNNKTGRRQQSLRIKKL
jgi:hypothetical protein